jgi:DNA invertase Pin-like site-specific DNA recombinase
MLIGYIRVSKSDGSQTLAPQRDMLLAAGVDPARIYEDLASGRRDDRPGLAACLKALQPGNTLVLWKLDRLGRDLKHLVTTVDELRRRSRPTPCRGEPCPKTGLLWPSCRSMASSA